MKLIAQRKQHICNTIRVFLKIIPSNELNCNLSKKVSFKFNSTSTEVKPLAQPRRLALLKIVYNNSLNKNMRISNFLFVDLFIYLFIDWLIVGFKCRKMTSFGHIAIKRQSETQRSMGRNETWVFFSRSRTVKISNFQVKGT